MNRSRLTLALLSSLAATRLAAQTTPSAADSSPLLKEGVRATVQVYAGGTGG